MPGHKGFDIFDKYGYGDFLRRIPEWDITEIKGADNLFRPEGIIKDTMEDYRELYDAKASYLLINGTSGGIIGALLGTVPCGSKVLAARNCHKSVHSGMVLGNIEAEYVYPELLKEGIQGEIKASDVEMALKNNPDIKAVILPSPNYYGVCSNIKKIAKVTHEAGKILIVDQAHGAHLKFFNKFGYGQGMPMSAEDAGADIVINSIHKTLASFTQSAVINVMTDRVDKYLLEEKLALVQSTSPSYVLMATLYINGQILKDHGRELIGEWKGNIEYFYEEAGKIKNLKLIDVDNLDRSKFNIDFSSLGIDGHKLEELLIEKNIYSEFFTGDILMCMSGIGNTREDVRALIKALKEIDKSKIGNIRLSSNSKGFLVPKPGPNGEITSSKTFVKLKDSIGKTSGRMIIPYPPGIPFVCPGEIITEETAGILEDLINSGKVVFGINEDLEVMVYRK